MEGGEERPRDSVVFWKVIGLDPAGVPSCQCKDLVFRHKISKFTNKQIKFSIYCVYCTDLFIIKVYNFTVAYYLLLKKKKLPHSTSNDPTTRVNYYQEKQVKPKIKNIDHILIFCICWHSLQYKPVQVQVLSPKSSKNFQSFPQYSVKPSVILHVQISCTYYYILHVHIIRFITCTNIPVKTQCADVSLWKNLITGQRVTFYETYATSKLLSLIMFVINTVHDTKSKTKMNLKCK